MNEERKKKRDQIVEGAFFHKRFSLWGPSPHFSSYYFPYQRKREGLDQLPTISPAIDVQNLGTLP